MKRFLIVLFFSWTALFGACGVSRNTLDVYAWYSSTEVGGYWEKVTVGSDISRIVFNVDAKKLYLQGFATSMDSGVLYWSFGSLSKDVAGCSGLPPRVIVPAPTE
jgi:hypothetical protein